jgi:hypothetical protein
MTSGVEPQVLHGSSALLELLTTEGALLEVFWSPFNPFPLLEHSLSFVLTVLVAQASVIPVQAWRTLDSSSQAAASDGRTVLTVAGDGSQESVGFLADVVWLSASQAARVDVRSLSIVLGLACP